MDEKNSDWLTLIITGGVMTVAFGGVLLVGAHYFLTPASAPKPQTCQTIRVGEGEELGDVVKRMKAYDSGITLKKLAQQNNLYEDGRLLNLSGGTELKYCY